MINKFSFTIFTFSLLSVYTSKFQTWQFFLVKKKLACQIFLDKENLPTILHLHEQFFLVKVNLTRKNCSCKWDFRHFRLKRHHRKLLKRNWKIWKFSFLCVSVSFRRCSRFLVEQCRLYKKFDDLLGDLSQIESYWKIQDCKAMSRGGGVIPSKRLMGMYRWMGSHFHNWIDYNGVVFYNTVTLRMGLHIFGISGKSPRKL